MFLSLSLLSRSSRSTFHRHTEIKHQIGKEKIQLTRHTKQKRAKSQEVCTLLADGCEVNLNNVENSKTYRKPTNNVSDDNKPHQKYYIVRNVFFCFFVVFFQN